MTPASTRAGFVALAAGFALAPAIDAQTGAAVHVGASSFEANAGVYYALDNGFVSMGTRFFVSCWFAKRDWADRNADAVRRYRAAIDRAGAWATRNPVAAAAILRKYMSISEDRAHEEHARSIDPAFVQPIIDAAVKYKLLDHPMEASDIIWK